LATACNEITKIGVQTFWKKTFQRALHIGDV